MNCNFFLENPDGVSGMSLAEERDAKLILARQLILSWPQNSLTTGDFIISWLLYGAGKYAVGRADGVAGKRNLWGAMLMLAPC